MPKQKYTPIKEEGKKTSRSQLEASKNYDKENVYQVRLRVPKSWEQPLKDKADQEGMSVNALINSLIADVLGIE